MLDPETQRILTEFAEATKAHLIEDIRNQRVTKYGSVGATGKLERSLEIEYTETGFRILGNSYVYFLIYGRKPGSVPPKGALLEWMAERGIPVEKEDAIRFGNMRTKGTTVYQENRGARSPLFELTLSQDTLNFLAEKVASDYLIKITSEVLKGF